MLGADAHFRDGQRAAIDAVATDARVALSPAAGFSAGAAMGRNKLTYALADVAVVVSSAEGSGGTWTGAVEALDGGWVPVLVRADDDAPPGNVALLGMGASPLRSDDVGDAVTASDLIALVPPSARCATDLEPPHEQRGVFDA